jgi:hypothetical protein
MIKARSVYGVEATWDHDGWHCEDAELLKDLELTTKRLRSWGYWPSNDSIGEAGAKAMGLEIVHRDPIVPMKLPPGAVL